MGMLLTQWKVVIGGDLHVLMVEDLRPALMAVFQHIQMMVVALEEKVVSKLTVCSVMEQNLWMMGIDLQNPALQDGQCVISLLNAKGWMDIFSHGHMDILTMHAYPLENVYMDRDHMQAVKFDQYSSLFTFQYGHRMVWIFAQMSTPDFYL